MAETPTPAPSANLISPDLLDRIVGVVLDSLFEGVAVEIGEQADPATDADYLAIEELVYAKIREHLNPDAD